ncbi:MAG: GatB/YqeY domain-containing protein [Gudongella sp.]|nr:GatB/YqeY domain-containing protein [Gudongella sp.]
MSLKDKLMEDYKSSIKSKDTIRKNTVIMVRAAVKQREVDERIELSDEKILDIISKQLKEKKMAILEFQKGNRQDLVDLTNLEIDILLDYLPKQLTQAEVDVIVKDTISEIGAKSVKDIGLIMKAVMPKVKGMADGNMVNKAVRSILK